MGEGDYEPDEQCRPDLVQGNVYQSHLQEFHQVPLENVNQLQQTGEKTYRTLIFNKQPSLLSHNMLSGHFFSVRGWSLYL